MKIAFRVDASILIGSGHVMRCAALADALRSQGANVFFICREHHGNYIGWLEQKGYYVARLPPPCQSDGYDSRLMHATWLGADETRDCAESSAALAIIGSLDWLIVDHYAIDARWESAMRPKARHILVIDDLADREHDCDILLDQNLQPAPNRYRSLIPTHTIPLLGPRFALLRPEFSAARKNQCKRDGAVRRLLVFFGGVDPTGMTLEALDALTKLDHLNLVVDVVVGKGNPHLATIEHQTSAMPNIALHVQTTRMAELMSSADLMVGAAGSATWECCCLGLPALLICVAANQQGVCSELAHHKCAVCCSTTSGTASIQLADWITKLAGRQRLMKGLSARSSTLVDGLGVERVVAMLINSSKVDHEQLLLRSATVEDMSFAFSLRNDPSVYTHFFIPQPVAWDDHVAWFSNSLTASNQRLLIIEDETGKAGVLRIDLQGDTAEISISLRPSLSGHGKGSASLQRAKQWIKQHAPKIKHVVARIRHDNKRSMRAFQKAGFKEHHRTFTSDIDNPET